MATLYLVPEWFFGFDIFMQLLFSLATAFVAYYALRLYMLAEQREIRLICSSFLMISFSYLAKALTNWFVVAQIQDQVRALTLENLNAIGLIGIYSYIVLFTSGLVTLAYLTFRIESSRVYSLLLITNIAILMLSENKAFALNALSSLLLLYICIHYFIEYQGNKNPKTFLIFVAFLALLISGIEFIFVSDFYGNYVISHFLELTSYILILASLFIKIKKPEK